jgi:hypothetical protein
MGKLRPTDHPEMIAPSISRMPKQVAVTVIRIAVVGLGKIARDQHIPSIAGTAGIELAAVVSRNASIDGLTHFATLDELLDSGPSRSARRRKCVTRRRRPRSEPANMCCSKNLPARPSASSSR